MAINERVQQLLSETAEDSQGRPDVQSAYRVLEELKQTGVLQDKGYTLPSADAVDRQMLRSAGRSLAYKHD